MVKNAPSVSFVEISGNFELHCWINASFYRCCSQGCTFPTPIIFDFWMVPPNLLAVRIIEVKFRVVQSEKEYKMAIN